MLEQRSGRHWILVIGLIALLVLLSPVVFHYLGRLLLPTLVSGFELLLSALPVPPVYALIGVLLILAWYVLGVLLLARRHAAAAVLLLYVAVVLTVLVVRAFAAVGR